MENEERNTLAGALWDLFYLGVHIGTKDIEPIVIQINIDSAPVVQYNKDIA